MVALIFDTETSDRDNPEIIEAAFAEAYWGQPMLQRDVFCQRFQPSQPIKLGALATHHIMDEALIGCEPSCMFELPPCGYLIGHNVDFDAKAAGVMENGPKRIDTCSLARHIWPETDCYSQGALLYLLDRKNARERLREAHGAAADVLICKTILDAEISALGAASWEELWQRSEVARVPTKMPWGKHRDVPIAELPGDYIAWCLRLPDLDQYLRRALTGDKEQQTMFCPK